MRAQPQWRWHLDEVFEKTNGDRHYLWRAVDHEDEVLESYVTTTRDRHAAPEFLKKAMRRNGRPEKIITDKRRSYGAALKEIGVAQGTTTLHFLSRVRLCLTALIFAVPQCHTAGLI